jgi:hypothetical protein
MVDPETHKENPGNTTEKPVDAIERKILFWRSGKK